MPLRRQTALPDFRFMVEFGGLVRAVFKECSGLKAEIAVFEYEEGGENNFVHKLPGRRKWSNITLKRGMTDSMDFWVWYLEIVAGKTRDMARNLSIILYDESHRQGMRWDLIAAIPVKWEGPTMKADGATVTVETLEIAHHGITMSFQTGGV